MELLVSEALTGSTVFYFYLQSCSNSGQPRSRLTFPLHFSNRNLVPHLDKIHSVFVFGFVFKLRFTCFQLLKLRTSRIEKVDQSPLLSPCWTS